MVRILLFLCGVSSLCFSQGKFPHTQAHAHNEYEHAQPLWGALNNSFILVEADVHLTNERLLVSHNRLQHNAPTLQHLYLAPLDSLLTRHGDTIYPNFSGTFYLMIYCKTEAESTYRFIQKEVARYSSLRCTASRCPVKIFI
jgi:hypothetical protein